MSTILAILSIVAGVLATLCMLVMLVAGSPNSTPEQIATIKRLMLMTALIGAAGFVGGAWAIIAGRPWLACGLGATPALFVTLLTARLLVLES